MRQVKILSDSDFMTDSDHKINLKDKSLTVILFKDEEDLSIQLTDIWNDISQKISGPVFAICNMKEQTLIPKNFEDLSKDTSSSYHMFASHKVPFILVYRDSKPKKIYCDLFSGVNLTIFLSTLIDNYSDESMDFDNDFDNSETNAV